MEQNLRLETSYNNKFRLIAGVDEAGRGAIAGPLVIAGVILPVNFDDYIIRDSKKLSSLQREKALKIIKKNAIELVVVIKSVTEVENKNPLEATREGMKEILSNFKHKPDICLIDGKEKVTLEGFNTLSVIAGDSKSINIAAASIVAKVTRDRIMRDLAKIYPVYNWDKNKGYPNKSHIQSLIDYGVCHLHRKTYEPIKSLIKKGFDKEKVKSKYGLI